MMNILEHIGDIFQWDSGLSLTVNGQLIDEAGTQYVHYQHKGKSAVYSVAVTDGVAAIPNELLQVPGAFNAYAYVLDESNGKTLVCREFHVVPRPMPPEYIYDPTPVITYPELVQLVEDLNVLKTKLTMVDAMAETLPAGELATATVDDSGDGLTFIFGIPRGEKGEDAIVDPTLSIEGEAADAKATGDALATKVDKVAGKGLSTNDFTNTDKTQTDFVYEHFGEVGSIIYLTSGGNADDIVIEAQHDIVLNPAQAEDGDVYISEATDGNKVAIKGYVDEIAGGFSAEIENLYNEDARLEELIGKAQKKPRIIYDTTLTENTPSTTYIIEEDTDGNPFVLSEAEVFVFAPAATGASGTSAGYISVKSEYFTAYTILYGAIIMFNPNQAISTHAHIVTNDDIPTYMNFVSNNWAATAKNVNIAEAWGTSLTTHKQIEGIRLSLNGTAKFLAGTRIVVLGTDK